MAYHDFVHHMFEYYEMADLNNFSSRLVLQGHSVTRKLNSDGRVETMQMLHNLNQGLFK